MAREKMVTRTVFCTKVNCLCIDIETAEPFNKEVTVSGKFSEDDSDKLERKLRKLVDVGTVKFVSIVAMDVVETLMGMPEQKFIENSEILPPRGTQVDTDVDLDAHAEDAEI